jgi:hypothetical protein
MMIQIQISTLCHSRQFAPVAKASQEKAINFVIDVAVAFRLSRELVRKA